MIDTQILPRGFCQMRENKALLTRAALEKATRELIEERLLSNGGKRPSEEALNLAIEALVNKAEREQREDPTLG